MPSTDNGQPGIQPILFRVQSILFHARIESLPEIVVQKNHHSGFSETDINLWFRRNQRK
jgi:hypothetical protein